MFIHGFMVDLARCLEKRGYYRALIDFMLEKTGDVPPWDRDDL